MSIHIDTNVFVGPNGTTITSHTDAPPGTVITGNTYVTPNYFPPPPTDQNQLTAGPSNPPPDVTGSNSMATFATALLDALAASDPQLAPAIASVEQALGLKPQGGVTPGAGGDGGGDYSTSNPTDGSTSYPTYGTSNGSGGTYVAGSSPVSCQQLSPAGPTPAVDKSIPVQTATPERTQRAKAIQAQCQAQGLDAHQANLFMAMAMQETDSLSCPGGATCGDAGCGKTGDSENVGFMNFNAKMLSMAGVDVNALRRNANDPGANVAAFKQLLGYYSKNGGEEALVAAQRGGYGASPSAGQVGEFSGAIRKVTQHFDEAQGLAFSGQRYAFDVSHI